MPPLISYEEALALGEIEDHAEIEALVDRAFEARRDDFGDSTDMCSLVNAKSGGCAEDCGFCAQSKYAEADTPMHAMMTPGADPRARAGGRGGGRAPLLHGHPGPGPVQARLPEHPRRREARRRAHQPQALRVDRPHVGRPRQGAARGGHPARPPQRRDGGVVLPRGLVDRALRGPAAHDRRGARGGPRDLRRRHPQPRRVARAARRDGVRAGEDRPDQRPDQPAQPAPGHQVRRPRLHGPVGGGQVDRDLPADPARTRCSGSAAAASRTSASSSRSRSRPG